MTYWAQVDKATRQIISYGQTMNEPDDDGVELVELDDQHLSRFEELGVKTLEGDGSITVTPPDPLPPPPPVPDYGGDATADQGNLVQAVGTLRDYLGVASPTAAQTVAALKLLIRVVLFLTKRVVG